MGKSPLIPIPEQTNGSTHQSSLLDKCAFTDEVSDPWFAPAGLRRGRLTKPTDVEVQLNQGDRDALYGPGNVVNFQLTKFLQDGIVIYGQKTTQRASTALDRLMFAA